MKDHAVERIKSLPKNRNVRIQRDTYACKACPGFYTNSLVEAWYHSASHGPWPVRDSGHMLDWADRPNTTYSRVLGVSDVPSVRKVV